MSLLFGASSSDRVDHGSGATLDDLASGGAMGAWVWFKPTSLSGVTVLISKEVGFAGWELVNDNGALRFLVTYAGATDDDATSNAAVLTNGVWNFAYGLNDQSAGQANRLFVGTLTAPATEVAGYINVTTGAGGRNSDAAAVLMVGNLDRTRTSAPSGSIQRGGAASVAKTLAEIQDIQRLTPPQIGLLSGVKLSFDYRATGVQADYSGNGNTGTITGATLAANFFNPQPSPRHNPMHLLAR